MSAIESFRVLTIAVTGIAVAACGSDEEEPAQEEEDPAEHACEHVSEAGTALAALPAKDEAPQLAVSEDPYTVALVPMAPGYLVIKGPVEGLLFAGTAGVVNALSDGTSGDLLPDPAPNERCGSEIPEHFDLDLDEPGDYVLSVGPAAVSEVWLMLTGAEGHGHHE